MEPFARMPMEAIKRVALIAHERLVPAYGVDDRVGDGSDGDAGDNRSNEPVSIPAAGAV